LPIRILSQQLINQIAAGEVIVNMASVVKELVENSIDANSTSIEVSLSKDLLNLRIQDDGIGMNEEDAELSLQRHATSKISAVDDLFDLQTRGFRGEAVPSIASVSRLELKTRRHQDNSGTRVVVNGGRIEKIEPTGCPKGTSFDIRDLFFNTPARRKFLKTTQREMNTIMKTIVRQSLAAPHIGFRVERDNEVVLDLPTNQGLEDRFLQLQGSRIKDPLLPVQYDRLIQSEKDDEEQLIRVRGFIAHPHSSRGDRSAQYLFVNSRPFSQKQITASIEQACRGFLMVGRFPIYCLFIEVPGSQVDFNVHPTKEEVRFTNERAITGAAYRAVREPLEAHQLVPDVEIEEGKKGTETFTQQPRQSAPPKPRFQDDGEDFMQSPSALIRKAFEKKQAREVQTDLTQEIAKHQADADSQSQNHSPDQIENHQLNLDGDKLSLSQSEAIPDAKESERISVPYAGITENKDHDFWLKPDEPVVLGQLALTYVVAKYGEDLLVIDQHAAHERLRFLELRLRAEQMNEGLSAQMMLVPQTFDVASEQASLLAEALDDFKQCGFELEQFGGSTWSINSVPVVLERLDPVAVVQDVLDDLQQQGKSNRIENLRDQILIRTACHSSIRGGHYLTQNEMQELLVLMKRHKLSFTCPHGRPTIIRLSKDQLEKQFGRLGA